MNNKPNLNKIIKDNLDKGKFQSKSSTRLPKNGWLDDYAYGGYISDRAKATQFGQYKTGGQGCPDGYINIDGECIKKDSYEYKQMLNRGLVGTMEGDRFWGNKATLQPVTVVSSRDKDTQAFYDKLREGRPERYDAIVKLGLKYGFPHVSLKEKAEAFDFLDPNAFNTEEENKEGYYRAHYSPIQQRIYLSANQDREDTRNKYIAELAHHKQLMDKGSLDFSLRGLKRLGHVLANSVKNLELPIDAYDREYDLPGTLEYQAHQEIEPKLLDEYHDLFNKQRRESLYYESPGFYQDYKPTQKYKRGGGYFPEYKSFAPPRMNGGGEPCYDAQGNQIPCPEEQARLNKQKAVEDATKSFLENWYNSPMHRKMLKNSLNRGLGLFLNKRVDKMTQDRLKTLPGIKVNIAKMPEGTFDISDTSLQGYVNKDNPSLINISAFSSLEDAKGTGVHEGSHLADYAAGIPIKDVKRMRRAASAPTDEYGAYIIGDGSGTEPKGRVYGGRYELLKAGIYNPFTEELSRENFERGEREVPEFKRINDELRSIYSTDKIFNLYNTTSKSNNAQPQTMAKYGFSVQSKEELPKYQSIGEVTGKNCVGQCWKPTLSDRAGNSGGMFVGNTPISWKELLKYTEVDTKDKQFKKYLKDLQSKFPGLTQNQFLAARNDSFRIKGRIEDLPTWDKPENQTYDRAWYPFYRPLMQPNVRVTVPQILEFQSQQPGGLGGYQQVVESNYGKKKFTNGGENEKEVGNFPTPYSNEFVDKYQKDYNAFYASPRYYGQDDGYDAYFHNIKDKAPFSTMVQQDLGPTWEYRGTHMQTKNFPSDWQRRIDKGKATKEDFKYYPNYIQDQNIGDTQAAGLTRYLQSQSGKPSFSFYRNGGDISVLNLEDGLFKKSYNPKLGKKDHEFLEWYAKNTLEGQRKIPFDSSEQVYDFYSYFKNTPKSELSNPEAHFPDTYKYPNHPTFSNESIYSTPENPGGYWKGEKYFPKGKFIYNKKNGGDISIPDLDADKWLTKYQSKGQVSFSLPNPRDLQRQMMESNESTSLGTKIDEAALRQASIDRQRRNQGSIRQAGPERSAASKAWAIATHPMTALAYKVKGQDIPENFEKGERNALDYAMDVINPATYLGAAGRTAHNITSPKEMFYRTLNSIEGDDNMLDVVGDALVTAGIPGLAKSTLKTLDKQFSNVGRQLEKIRFEGEAKGLSPHEIAKQQMQKVGITSNQRQAYTPLLSDFAEKYIRPYGYEGMGGKSKIKEIFENIKRGGVNYSEPGQPGEINSLNLAKVDVTPERGDAWRLYLGKPQKYNTFRIAETSPIHPSYSPEQLANMDIYSINSEYAKLGIKPNTGFPDLMSPSTIENNMNLLRKKINIDAGNQIMGGYNKRLNQYGLDYNDIWDLNPSVTPLNFMPQSLQTNDKFLDSKLGKLLFMNQKKTPYGVVSTPKSFKLSAHKVLGKPFMAHEVLPYTSNDLTEEMNNIINYNIQKLKDNPYDMTPKIQKMEAYKEELKNYPKQKKGGVIKDNRGQWAHPGEITEIDSNRITMQGVPYPVLGIGADGQQIMMYPDQDYMFNQAPVMEIPMKKTGGWLDTYQDGGTQYTVKPGDTLSSIAQKNKTTLRRLIDANNIDNPNLIRANQNLIIPSSSTNNQYTNIYQDWNTISDRQKAINASKGTDEYSPDEQIITSYYNEHPDDSYVVVDKKRARMNVYKGNKLQKSYEVGTGVNPGDAQTVTRVVNGKTDWEGGNKSTGAGVYKISRIDPKSHEYFGLPAFNLTNDSGMEVATTIHGTPIARRTKFDNNNILDNRMSNGCVNGKCYDLEDLYKRVDVGSNVYILPEDAGNQFQIVDGKPVLRVDPKNRAKYNTYTDQKGNVRKGQGVNQSINTLQYKPIRGILDKQMFQENVYQTNDFNDDEEYNSTTKPFFNALVNNKKQIMKSAKIPSDVYNELAKMAFGIYGTESNFGDTHSALGNFGRAVSKAFNPSGSSSPDYKSKATTYGADEDNRSVGLTQLRWSYLNEDEKNALKELGITSNKDFLDPTKAAIGTVAILGIRYNQQLTSDEKKDIWKNLPTKWNKRANYGDRVKSNSRYIKFEQLEPTLKRRPINNVKVPYATSQPTLNDYFSYNILNKYGGETNNWLSKYK